MSDETAKAWVAPWQEEADRFGVSLARYLWMQGHVTSIIDAQMDELRRAPDRALAVDRLDELRVLRKRILRKGQES